MTVHNHAIVWVDHRVAKIFYLGLDATDRRTIDADLPTGHLHHKANVIGSGHVAEDHEFLNNVGDKINAAGEVLVIGPAGEKVALVKYLESHRPDVARKVVKVETVDHLTDKEIAAYGMHHFKLGSR